ncbi:hypothetical protein [Pseudomonas sp. MS19]|uniref:hypothetical protein n=1 Tax=Pseudomonas sp. MS19 TaxID=2579939 RepID=UPI001562BC6C|nr:hypothetical protein [Pseudomonas sp. MS19]NRH26725.1 hypothetical protein [Pseudomonas sp. MS19]
MDLLHKDCAMLHLHALCLTFTGIITACLAERIGATGIDKSLIQPPMGSASMGLTEIKAVSIERRLSQVGRNTQLLTRLIAKPGHSHEPSHFIAAAKTRHERVSFNVTSIKTMPAPHPGYVPGALLTLRIGI